MYVWFALGILIFTQMTYSTILWYQSAQQKQKTETTSSDKDLQSLSSKAWRQQQAFITKNPQTFFPKEDSDIIDLKNEDFEIVFDDEEENPTHTQLSKKESVRTQNARLGYAETLLPTSSPNKIDAFTDTLQIQSADISDVINTAKFANEFCGAGINDNDLLNILRDNQFNAHLFEDEFKSTSSQDDSQGHPGKALAENRPATLTENNDPNDQTSITMFGNIFSEKK